MSTDLALLEARIKRLEDIEAIRELRMYYHHYTNDGPHEQLAGLYTEDAYVDFEGLSDARGRKAIGDLLLSLLNGVSLIKQFITNHMVKIDGDTATGISYLDARYAQDGQSLIAAVRYTDKYRRTAEGWKFSEMLVKIYFTVPVTKGWAEEKLHYIKPLSST